MVGLRRSGVDSDYIVFELSRDPTLSFDDPWHKPVVTGFPTVASHLRVAYDKYHGANQRAIEGEYECPTHDRFRIFRDDDKHHYNRSTQCANHTDGSEVKHASVVLEDKIEN